ncbi:MAG: DoxX family membrane protein [Chloroflexi bacterium]|nr:DoxX family membrane protein [Chloroflexota bacterium]
MANIVHQKVQISDPPLVQKLFADTRFAWIWLIVRLYLAYEWIDASSHKIFDPKWVQTGESLKGYWLGAVKVDPKPVAYFDWYRSFLQFMLDNQAYTWFAKLVAYGELLIGIALLLGVFTGIAAFFGGFMNWNFMMAGTASSNPLLFAAAVAMILAWKTAGYWGLDRVLLPLLGTPWKPGIVIQATPAPQPTSA